MITIEKLNEIYIRIHAEPSVKKEIKDNFSYAVPHYVPKSQWKWMQKNKGKQSLYDYEKSILPIGLLPQLSGLLNSSKYEFEIQGNFDTENFSELEAIEFIKTLNVPDHIEIRDYQLKYFVKCIRNQRGICLSPVNSGKSYIMYLLFRYFNRKTLILVPSVSLVSQLKLDFQSYGYDSDSNCHTITAGVEKSTDKILTMSTWQSLTTQNRDFFNDFKMFLSDEVHSNAATVVSSITRKMDQVPIRIGFTGTMTGKPLYDQTIIGCFGPVITYITNKEMIDRGFSSDMIIKAIVLQYNKLKNPTDSFEEELPWLLTNNARNDFIAKLACSLKGNTFVMFRNISHGKELLRLIQKNSKYPVYFVDGSIKVEDRENIRQTIEKSENSITLASVVFATGINITTINNILFTHPSKSRIRILQSIGRGLRKNKNKTHLTVFDIADRFVPNEFNTTYNQFNARLKLYKQEKFEVKPYSVNLLPVGSNEATKF